MEHGSGMNSCYKQPNIDIWSGYIVLSFVFVIFLPCRLLETARVGFWGWRAPNGNPIRGDHSPQSQLPPRSVNPYTCPGSRRGESVFSVSKAIDSRVAQTLAATISGAGRKVRGGRKKGLMTEQDVVGSAGMLVEPTRLKQHVICGTISTLSVWLDLWLTWWEDCLASQLGYRQSMPKQSEDNWCMR